MHGVQSYFFVRKQKLSNKNNDLFLSSVCCNMIYKAHSSCMLIFVQHLLLCFFPLKCLCVLNWLSNRLTQTLHHFLINIYNPYNDYILINMSCFLMMTLSISSVNVHQPWSFRNSHLDPEPLTSHFKSVQLFNSIMFIQFNWLLWLYIDFKYSSQPHNTEDIC